jgi:hypothetical protein
MALESLRYSQILQEARNRTAGGASATMVVQAHLAQLRLFMTRRGLEFYAAQDTYGMRREFLRRVVEENQLLGRLESIIDSYLLDGRGLFYMRPSKELYKIHYFTADQYRTFYDEHGDLEEVQIIYSFRVRNKRGFGAPVGMPTGAAFGQTQFGGIGDQEVRWLKMRVFADRIEQSETAQNPQFDNVVFGAQEGTVKKYVNTLGFVPAVEVYNNRGLEGGAGRGEFDGVASFVLEHDRMSRAIRKNLQFFGAPTLVSSRPKSDLIEADDSTGGSERATMASNSGFIGLNRRSTRSSDPSGLGSDGNVRMPRIIANVEAADRVALITPDPVPGDLTGYVSLYAEAIRAALGGVDDLSISSGATAYEVKTLYGRVAATSQRKCRDLYEYGLCKLFSLMIIHEERLFRESFAEAIGLQKPMPVIKEMITPEMLGKKTIEDLQAEYNQKMDVWNGQLIQRLRQAQDEQNMPPNLVGLMPDGSAKVAWRFTGQIFEDSPQDLLQQSIVCRNLQELGVSSIEALQHLFPEKTPEERAGMLGGYPFRVVEAAQRSVGVFMDILRGFYQVPHPERPDLPLAADPMLNLTPFIYNALTFLKRELSYSGSFQDVDSATLPPALTDADRYRASRGFATELERNRQRDRDAAAAAGGTGALGSLGAGVPGAGGDRPAGRDTDAVLPGPGGVLAYDPADPYPAAGDQLGAPGWSAGGTPVGPGGSGSPMGGSAMGGAPGGAAMGAPDFAAATFAAAGLDANGYIPAGAQSGGPPGAGRPARTAGGRPGGKSRKR